MKRKQACPELRNSRKAQHPDLYMNVISLKIRYSTALLTGITQSFVMTCRNKDAHYRYMYKRNSIYTSNVVDRSMDFYAYNTVPVTINILLRSAVSDGDFAPVAVPDAQSCWWTKFYRITPYSNGY